MKRSKRIRLHITSERLRILNINELGHANGGGESSKGIGLCDCLPPPLAACPTESLTTRGA